jgi:hypothetical protein
MHGYAPFLAMICLPLLRTAARMASASVPPILRCLRRLPSGYLRFLRFLAL